MIVLYALAGAFEMVGLALALHGFKRTWAEFVEGEPLSSAFARSSWSAVQRSTDAVNRWSRRVLRLKGRPKVVKLGIASEVHTTGRLTARVSFGPLPSIENDPAGFAEETHLRLQRLHATAQDVQESVADERLARVEAVSELDSRTATQITELAGKSESIAVGGLVEQIYGWFFIVAGVALGTIGNLVQAVQS